MSDPATYRRYAEECRRIAQTLPEEHRHVLHEIARAWIALADEHDEHQTGPPSDSRDLAH
jgi:hypothetical protein